MERAAGSSRKLFFFISQLPYAWDQAYIENEVTVLCRRFDQVFIIPEVIKKGDYQIPGNARIIKQENLNYSASQKIKLILLNAFLIFRILFSGILFSRQKSLALKSFKTDFFLLFEIIKKAQSFMQYIKSDKDAVFYSYWFSTEATLLGILKEKGLIRRFFSRAHGFDLYEFTDKPNYIPFREFQLRAVNRVFCSSVFGRDYLIKRYPGQAEKVDYSYPGVEVNFEQRSAVPAELIIVSNSNIVPVKRLHLIVEALTHVKVNTHWVHFGDGYLRGEIEKLALQLPANIAVEIKGYVSRDKIMSFYKTNPVSVFMDACLSETVPVPMMEAISFGIPLIGTKVGGVPEIINDLTGILLDKHFAPAELAEVLNTFNKSEFVKVERREKIKSFCKANYDSEVNYNGFALQLLQNAN